MSENFYTGGNEYFIVFERGTHHICVVDYNCNPRIFTGSYEKCLQEKERIIADNADYDYNL